MHESYSGPWPLPRDLQNSLIRRLYISCEKSGFLLVCETFLGLIFHLDVVFVHPVEVVSVLFLLFLSVCPD